MSKIKKTRVQWARDIRVIHKQTVKQTVDGIFKLGRMLIAARKSLLEQRGHGQFEQMIASDLPFDASTAQRLMKIARDPRLRKSCTVQVLPAAWGTLYELTKLSDTQFEQAVTSGAIRPNTTRGEVVALRPDYTPRPLPMRAASGPVHCITVERDDTPPPRPSVAITDDREPPPRRFTDLAEVARQEAEEAQSTAMQHQIDQLARDLQAGIERGTVRVDAAFSMWARSVAEKLLTMADRYGAARLTESRH